MLVPTKTPAVLLTTSNHSNARLVGSRSCKNSTINPKRINPKIIRERFKFRCVELLLYKAQDHRNDAAV